MRLLHYADIHFHAKTLDDLREPCARLEEIAREERPDVIVIAGDLTIERGVIDNGTAVACRTHVRRMAEVAPTFVLLGNHDRTNRAGEPNNVRAILADETGSVLPNVHIIDEPGVVALNDVSLAFLPYPDRALFHARTSDTDLGSLSDRLADVARGLAVEAMRAGGCPLLVYHGTIEGGRYGDERSASLTTRGEDVVLPLNALAGFGGALCGHLHHHQTIQMPDGYAFYSGCVAPLTFGERSIAPRCLMWEVVGGALEDVEPISLPVTHQRIQIEVGPEDWDDNLDAALNLDKWINGEHDAFTYRGARVKVKATLPKERLRLLTPEIVEAVRNESGLHDLRVDPVEIPSGRTVLQAGEDRAARVDILKALETWAEESGDPQIRASLDEITDIARDVERDVRASNEDPRFEFEPVRLELENYKTIGKATIDFDALPRQTGVFGPTGIGKSNLILALAWLLYGNNPKSEDGGAKTNLGEIVRRGEREAIGRLIFRSQGKAWRVTRRVKVDGQGRGAQTTYLEAHVASGAFEPASGGNARATQQMIEALVGPPALHFMTRHLRQHGTSPVKLSSAQLADAINSTLQFSFEAREARGKAIRDNADATRRAAEVRVEALRDTLPSLERLNDQEALLKVDLREAQDVGLKAAAELDHAEEFVATAQRRLVEAEAGARQRAEAQQRLDALKSERAFVASKVQQHEATLAQAPDPSSVEALGVRVVDLRSEKDTASDRLRTLTDEHHMLTLEEAEALGALRESERATIERRREAIARAEAARRRLSDLAQAAALIGDVPCEGAPWVHADGSEIDMGTCQLLRHAMAARDQIPDANKTLEAATRNQSEAEADVQAATQRRSEAEARTARRQSERATEVEQARKHYGVVAERLLKAETEYARQQAALAAVAGARREYGTLTADLDRIDATMRELALVIGEAGATAGLDHARKELADAQGIVRQLRTTQQEALQKASRCEAGLEQVERSRDDRKDSLRMIAALEDDARREERRRLAAAYYAQAVGRSGIPSLLLEQLAPTLQGHVNDLLLPSGRALRIHTERVTTAGDVRTQINLEFQGPTSGGAWLPVAELSGGEEDLANCAWTVGLARTASEMTGVPLGVLFLDEPMVGVSHEYQEAALELLGSIRSHVDRMCVVSHREDFKAIVGGVVQLSQNGDGAIVEVQA